MALQDWAGTSLRLWRPPSHTMCGFTRASMGLHGAPAKQNASSTSRPHSRRVFSAERQTFLEPHAVMRHVQRGLFSCPNLLRISPMRTANSFMQIWQQKDEWIRNSVPGGTKTLQLWKAFDIGLKKQVAGINLLPCSHHKAMRLHLF